MSRHCSAYELPRTFSTEITIPHFNNRFRHDIGRHGSETCVIALERLESSAQEQSGVYGMDRRGMRAASRLPSACGPKNLLNAPYIVRVTLSFLDSSSITPISLLRDIFTYVLLSSSNTSPTQSTAS